MFRNEAAHFRMNSLSKCFIQIILYVVRPIEGPAQNISITGVACFLLLVFGGLLFICCGKPDEFFKIECVHLGMKLDQVKAKCGCDVRKLRGGYVELEKEYGVSTYEITLPQYNYFRIEFKNGVVSSISADKDYTNKEAVLQTLISQYGQPSGERKDGIYLGLPLIYWGHAKFEKNSDATDTENGEKGFYKRGKFIEAWFFPNSPFSQKSRYTLTVSDLGNDWQKYKRIIVSPI